MSLSKEYRNNLKQKMMTSRILWIGLTLSILIYVVIIVIVTQQPPTKTMISSDAMIIKILYGQGIAFALVASFLRGFLFNPIRLKAQLSKPVKTDLFPDHTQEESRMLNLVQWAFVPFIIVLAISEATTIMTLVASFMTYQPNHVMIGATISIILNIFTLFTYEGIFKKGEELLRNHPELLDEKTI